MLALTHCKTHKDLVKTGRIGRIDEKRKPVSNIQHDPTMNKIHPIFQGKKATTGAMRTVFLHQLAMRSHAGEDVNPMNQTCSDTETDPSIQHNMSGDPNQKQKAISENPKER